MKHHGVKGQSWGKPSEQPSKRTSRYVASHPHRDRDHDHRLVGSTCATKGVINSQARKRGRQKKMEREGTASTVDYPCSVLCVRCKKGVFL